MSTRGEISKDFSVKDPFGNTITCGSVTEISVPNISKRVDTLLLAVGKFMGWKDLSQVFVTDGSSMGDFCLTDKQLSSISKKFKVKIEHSDSLVDIAKRMED